MFWKGYVGVTRRGDFIHILHLCFCTSYIEIIIFLEFRFFSIISSLITVLYFCYGIPN